MLELTREKLKSINLVKGRLIDQRGRSHVTVLTHVVEYAFEIFFLLGSQRILRDILAEKPERLGAVDLYEGADESRHAVGT
ncbi:MAG: hypothetical protein K2K47_06425, partial [Duncaniella sp.]|nr:hypothetical protein [Duncaniella sp.]